MYAYRTIDTPRPREAAEARVAELQRMFVFTTYVITETTDTDGRDDVAILAINDTDTGEHRTIGAAIGAYIEACETRGLKVWNIDEMRRP